MPIAFSRLRPRWRGCSRVIPRPLRARIEIVERCRFSLDELRYQYPNEAASPA